MKTLLTATTLALFALGAGSAFASCNKTCATGYSYDAKSGACVKKSVSS